MTAAWKCDWLVPLSPTACVARSDPEESLGSPPASLVHGSRRYPARLIRAFRHDTSPSDQPLWLSTLEESRSCPFSAAMKWFKNISSTSGRHVWRRGHIRRLRVAL